MLLFYAISSLWWEISYGAPPITEKRNPAARDHISPINETLPRLTWEDAIAKGSRLWTSLQSGCYPDKVSPPSIPELRSNGWFVDPWPAQRCSYDDIIPPLPRDPMEAVGILRGPYYLEETISYHASGGAGTKFVATFSPKTGLIVAQNSRRDQSVAVFWSDAMFAMWQVVNARYSTPASALRYVLRSHITNMGTMYIIRRIWQQFPEGAYPIDIYPSGTSFDWFLALLGTPNGAGPIYLLLDHKRSLGLKTIKKITIFWSNPNSKCHMLMEFEDFQPRQPSGSQNVLLSNESRSGNDTSGDRLFDGCSPESLVNHASEGPPYETS